MSVRTAVEQASQAPAQASPKTVIRDLLDRNASAIGMSLPSGMSQERFTRLLLTAANTNPDLFKCDPQSFLAAGVACAQLGLEPNDARGLAYLIPFNDNRRGKVVNLILGYRGLMDLARRSGMVSSIQVFPVFEGDRFDYRLGLDPMLEHVPGDHDENPEKLTHVYAVAKVSGDPQFVVLTRRQVDKVRDASLAKMSAAAKKYSPWTQYYVEMAAKTAIRRLCKMLPQTVEMSSAMQNEERTLMLGDLGHVTVPDDEDVIDVDTSTGEVGAGDPPLADAPPSEPVAEDPPAEPGQGALTAADVKA